MFEIVLVVQVVLSVLLVLSILVQHGKGADAGVAFGSSSTSGSAFGAAGANSFLYKASVFLVIGFFSSSLLLAYLAKSQTKQSSIATDSVLQIPQKVVATPTLLKENKDNNGIPTN